MAVTFPTTLDDLTNPAASDDTAVVSHADNHSNANDAIEALEAKVGVNSSAVTSSLDYKVTSASSSNPGHKHTLAQGATDVTSTAAELNVLDGIPVTLTATELGYVDGVTSAIQTQLTTGAGNLTTHMSDTTTHGTTGDVVGTSDTQTLTNKRITKRITTITSSATPTINTDNCDVVTITTLGEAITSMTTNLSGTPTNFQSLIFRILDDGTGRAITWGTSFQAMGAALPTITTANKVLTVGFLYDTVDSKWGCIASVEET